MTSSYQQNEDLPLTMENEVKVEAKKYSWYIVAVTSVIAVMVLFAYTSNKSYLNMRAKVSSFRTTQLGSFNNPREAGKRYGDMDMDSLKTLFDGYKGQYKKVYTAEENDVRFGHFVNFLSSVDDRNEQEITKGGSAQHGITKFADWSPEEMTKMLGYKPGKGIGSMKIPNKKVSVKDYEGKYEDITSANWKDVYTTSIKDQGYCGSCWAFSGVSQVESDSIRYGYTTTSQKLSEQQIVSCDSDDGVEGCDGGYTEGVFDYAFSTGLVSDDDYPYTSYWDTTGTCGLTDSMTKLVGVSDYTRITGDTTTEKEEAMKAHILSTGPLSICVVASSWSSYTGGVLSVCDSNEDDVDHCVQLTGYEAGSDSGRGDDSGYWIIRNSWGSDWGYDGYIYVKYGEDLCAITDDPIYVTPTNLQR